ncbi:MAG: transposase [Elusimicrobia bacterium]|nr:transposase [Elusimicrobiota bacterium]
MGKKRTLRKAWSIAEKLEAVQAYKNGLTLGEVGGLFGMSTTTVGEWVRKHERGGIAALENSPRGVREGAPSPKVAAAAEMVAQVKQEQPEAGVGKVQGVLYRRGFLDLARETVRKILRGQGHGPILGRSRRRNAPTKVRFFERANPNELWQTDIMTFMIKGQYRVYLIGFMDDHSRFLVGWGLYRFQTQANVMEVFRAATEKHGLPKEVLSDNGRQYYSWRGKSSFTAMLVKLGIRHVRSRPYHPQTLGKIESFWRNVLQECLFRTPVQTFEDAQAKIGEYAEYYNFKRPHQGIGNVTPSDRYYGVAGQVKQIVEANTEKVAAAEGRVGEYRPPAYIVGSMGGKELRVVARDAEVVLKDVGAEKVESGNAEVIDGRASESREAAQSAGAAGPDPVGAGAAPARDGAVPGGGSVAGAVLPVDAGRAGGGIGCVGSQGAGAQGCAPGEGAEPGPEVPGAGGAPGGPGPATAQGAGPLEAVGGDGAADHRAQCLGTHAGGQV